MTSRLSLYVTCPKGLESLLAEESRRLGAEVVRETVGGVHLNGALPVAYTLCLWSRLANRVLLVLARFAAGDAQALYDGVRAQPWDEHLSPEGSFAVDFSGTGGGIDNSHFGALKCKDAVVDFFQDRYGRRPSVDKAAPALRLNARTRKGQVTLAVDLSGESLHRRGYRAEGGAAPLKENLAAALLLRADWPGVAARGGALIDPLCGSGTLLIEGAMMAMDIAPGLLRRRWGFSDWLGHVPALWQEVLEDARRRRERAMAREEWPEIRGYDASGRAVAQAEANIEQAMLRGRVRVLRRELSDFVRPTHRPLPTGLVIANPPYGERLGDEASLVHLYRHLGDSLRREFVGWQAAVFTGNPELGKRMGLRSHRQYQLFNGSIPSKLLLFDIRPEAFVDSRAAPVAPTAATPAPKALGPGAQMFANRLRKNLRRLDKWARRNGVQCYRVYDADMPEYAVAIDRYGDYCHIAEYAAPASVPEETARARLRDVLEAVQAVMGVPPQRIALKERRRQKGREQYGRQESRGEFLEVSEGRAKLLVNLFDYLDTGLFLDHRPVRLKIAELARGRRFLNLFCYTAAASVQAGVGGARYTTSVDLSRTYLQWARRNLALNGLSESRHYTVQADCRQWLKECGQQFDLILLDPPTFSNSKRMDDVLDIQRDHPALIRDALRCLTSDGLLIFSNNRQHFRLDEGLHKDYKVEDRTRWSLDEDFAGRQRPIHRCWFITHER